MTKTTSSNQSVFFRKHRRYVYLILFYLALFSCQENRVKEDKSILGKESHWKEGDEKARKFADKLHEEFDLGNCENLYEHWEAEVSTTDWKYLCSIYTSWGKTLRREKLPGKWGYIDGTWKVEVRYKTVFDKGEFEEVITLVEFEESFKIEGWTFQDLNFDKKNQI